MPHLMFRLPCTHAARAWLVGLLWWAITAGAAPVPQEVELAMRNNDLPKAEQLLKRALQAKPGNAAAHYQLGQVYERQDNFHSALYHLDQAQGIDTKLKFAESPEVFHSMRQRVQARLVVQRELQASEKRVSELQTQVDQLKQQVVHMAYYLGLMAVVLALVFIFRRRHSNQAAATVTAPPDPPSANTAPVRSTKQTSDVGCFSVLFVIAILVGGFMITPWLGAALLLLPLMLAGSKR